MFAEHRYFGQSFPFAKADAFKKENNKYLTVEQTLSDYVDLLKYLRSYYNADDKATISFGGSYGGMLAAWMRMKYPNVIQGAYAASAPTVYFKGGSVSPDAFDDLVSAVFANTYPDDSRCQVHLKKAFSIINDKKDDATT